MAVATSVHTIDKIKVVQTAYDLAMRLFAAEANAAPVPVTKEMLEAKLSELTDNALQAFVWVGERSSPPR
jgi:hypothetical protein